jgi:signal transduction histidine kinase
MAAFLAFLTPFTRVYQANVAPLDWLGYVLLVLTGLALAVRRRWPFATCLVGVGSAVVYLGLRYPGWPVYVGAGLALVAYLNAVAWAGWPLALAGGSALAVADGWPEGWQPVRMVTLFIALLAIAAFTAQAAELRRRRAEELTRQRVVEERLRIAREMHDVLSHSLATISLQSGTGLRLFKTRPSEAEATLKTIRKVSGDALAQARATVARIREPVAAGDPTAPGLHALDALFASVRSAGVDVRASVEFRSGAVPPSIAAAVYRVVQESLTNVMRHAGPTARATVKVTHQADAIVVEIADTGGAAPPAPSSKTPGHGVMGMRERVLELGGELAAGPLPGGGFHVRAWLPTGGGGP